MSNGNATAVKSINHGLHNSFWYRNFVLILTEYPIKKIFEFSF